MDPIIDTHAYLGSSPLFRINRSVDDYILLQEQQREVGNELRFIVMAPSPSDNERLPRLTLQYPDLFYGCLLQFNPNEALQSLGFWTPRDLESLLTPSVVGLKLVTSIVETALDDRRMDDYARLAKDHGLPIVAHFCATGDDYTSPVRTMRFLERYPHVTLVAAHFGGLAEDKAPLIVDLAKKYPRLYLNTAGLSGQVKRLNNKGTIEEEQPPSERWRDFLREAADAIPHKILFGTDTGHLDFSYYPTNQIPPDRQRAIFYDTPRKVFKRRA